MKRKKINILTACLLSLFIISCGDNVPEPNSGGQGGTEEKLNTNSNAGVITSRKAQGVTERPATTNLQSAANRIEMPQLRGGNNHLFVVHTVAPYGINYAMEYHLTKKASYWTAYQWYKGFSSNETNFSRKEWEQTEWGGDPFQEDPLIPQASRTTLADHRSNGHDRGHILSSADRLNSKGVNEQTFYLSNIHPQSPGFNQQGIWLKLEERLRDVYDKNNFRDTLYVVKGGTIAEGQFQYLRNQLIRPQYFFMAVLCKNKQTSQGGYKAIGFWMEHKDNNDKNYLKYAISIDALEAKTGIDFFCNLPDAIENEVEKNMIPLAWGL